MTFREYLSDRTERLIVGTVFAFAAAGFLLATGTAAGVLVILLIAWLAIAAGMLLFDYYKCRTRLRELWTVMDGLDEKYLFAECVPKGDGIYERKLLELTRRAGKSMIRAVSDAREAQRAYQEYVESWVHEIKTPMTAAELVCRNADAKTRQKLLPELAQIKAHVERALFYARSESAEKDILIREADLAEIAAQAIANHRTLLIENGVRVETEQIEQNVYTDAKWAAFLLGQLLQNAARYRSEHPVVTLSARRLGKQVQLAVSDNGIGIPAHEQPRVFDRGFTGQNGRARGGSTGMGLYLCRRVAGCLEADLRLSSEEGRGTRVTITFPAKENLTKT